MSYVESTLAKGEQLLYSGKVSWWSQLLKIFIAIFGAFIGFITLIGAMVSHQQAAPVGLFWLLIAGVFGLSAWLTFVTTELAITNRRVIAKFGLIGRHTIEMRLQKVETVQVEQSILGRILSYGNIIVSGAGVPQAPVRHISKPMDFRKACMDAAEVAQTSTQTLARP